MKQVKGTMFKLIVKAIKVNKSGAYNNMLSQKAKDFLNQRIIDSIWYPFELFKECFNALSRVEAKDNEDILIEMGRMQRETVMSNFYKLTEVKGDLKSSMEKYQRFHKLLFNFGELNSEFISDTEMVVTFSDFEPEFKNFYYTTLGWIDKFIELCNGKKIQYKVKKKSWEGDNATEFLISWSS